MSYKTINVKEETYQKLVLYKHGNMTFDDVLNRLMDFIPEKKFYNLILEEHHKRMAKIKDGDYIESDTLDSALNQV